MQEGKSTPNIYKPLKLYLYTVWELSEFPFSYIMN